MTAMIVVSISRHELKLLMLTFKEGIVKKIYRITFLFKPGHFIMDEMTIERELGSDNPVKDAFFVLHLKYGDIIESILNIEEVF